jgi:8-demethyl-8-alpha-L-rhamnosyltetracenomycin-C 2'-O-methyltransferase
MQLTRSTESHPNIHLSSGVLDEIAKRHGTDKSSEHNGYVYHYEQHFGHLRQDPIRLLELGVHEGRSHRMWAEYFPNAQIYGIDLDKGSKQASTERIHIDIGDLDSQEYVDNYISQLGFTFDIIIDDAAHSMTQQRSNFLKFFPVVSPGGMYVVEDLGTSYWSKWGGSYRGHLTMIEMLKDLVDNIKHTAFQDCDDARVFNTVHTVDAPVSNLDRWVYALYFYKYICFVYRSPDD